MPDKKSHKISTFAFSGNDFFFSLDISLVIISAGVLILSFFKIVELAQFLAILALAGFLPVFFSAVKALFRRHLTIDLLASIALIFSFLSREWQSAIFISLMLASARILAYWTDNKTRRAVQSLLKLRPGKVHIKNNGQIIEKNIEEIKIGDLVLVDYGERIPIDGRIIEGIASIDQSSLTGESIPVEKHIGDQVFSSTLNVGATILIKTEKIGQDTTFAKIIKLIEDSQGQKSAIASITEKFITFYIFVTIFGCIIFYFYFHDLTKVLSILLVTCADDLAIAIPLAFLAAISIAAKNGVIIKGADYLEGFANVKTMVFDKTGTITLGQPEIKNIIVFGNYPENEFLSILGSAMIGSNHPISRSIYKFVKSKGIDFLEISGVDEKPGFGVAGKISKKIILAGKIKFLEESGVIFSGTEALMIEKEKEMDRIIVALGVGKRAIGFVSLTDAIRPDVGKIINEFRGLGVDKIAMLTGDNEKIAAQIAQEADIRDFKANLLPEDKVEFLKQNLSKKHKIIMVGDGINDAAALSVADIGVAMGAIGSDVAIESADVVLMKDDLKKIGAVIKLSRYVSKIVRQNFILWAILNSLGLFLVFTNILDPRGAAAFNFITDFIPLINSMKIFKYKL